MEPRDLLILMVAIFVWGFLAGGVLEQRVSRKEAIKAGVAHWITDENGDARFEYKK